MSKPRRGAPPGNQNARKHGFYSQALTEAEQLDLEFAEGIVGLDDEIAVLRVKIKELLEQDPMNLSLLMEASRTLARMVQVKYGLPTEHKGQLTDAMLNVIKNLGLPLGIFAAQKIGGLK